MHDFNDIDESLNRTFMELKQHPLSWLSSNSGLNRTFMELKQLLNRIAIGERLSLNRTFMELKQDRTV